MSEKISKTNRWLDLIALLLGRKIPLTVDEIMERVPAYAEGYASGNATARSTVRRMFERDKDQLREMGIPIESVDYRINFGGEVIEGYRIQDRNFYLPYLQVLGGVDQPRPLPPPNLELEREEATALAEALRQVEQVPGFPFAEEARTAASKLSFDLDREPLPSTPILWVEPPGAGEVLDRLDTLSGALLGGKRVTFRYRGIRRGTATDREVEPYGLYFQRDWYLVGFDRGREEIRVFRVSRMEDVHANTRLPKSRDFEVPADFDLRGYVGRPAWRLDDGEPLRADVHFRFPSSLVVERNQQGELVGQDPEGSSVRRFEVTDPDPFLRWVLGFAGEAEVVEPDDLRQAFREMAAQTMAQYRRRHG
jgi:proteasome accessory factor B